MRFYLLLVICLVAHAFVDDEENVTVVDVPLTSEESNVSLWVRNATNVTIVDASTFTVPIDTTNDTPVVDTINNTLFVESTMLTSMEMNESNVVLDTTVASTFYNQSVNRVNVTTAVEDMHAEWMGGLLGVKDVETDYADGKIVHVFEDNEPRTIEDELKRLEKLQQDIQTENPNVEVVYSGESLAKPNSQGNVTEDQAVPWKIKVELQEKPVEPGAGGGGG